MNNLNENNSNQEIIISLLKSLELQIVKLENRILILENKINNTNHFKPIYPDFPDFKPRYI